MTSHRYIKAILYGAVVIWTAVLFVHHEDIRSQWLKHFSTVVSLVLYVVIAFDLWLWKLPLFRGWFVRRPVIDGTWRVMLRSNWQDSDNDNLKIPPIEGYMVVRQTLSTLSMRLLTAESTSELVGTEIVCSADGGYCVSGVYRNEPRFGVRDRSPIHYGAVWLKVVTRPVEQMIGHYWTDRETAGEMELSQRYKKMFEDFQSAKSYYDKLGRSPLDR